MKKRNITEDEYLKNKQKAREYYKFMNSQKSKKIQEIYHKALFGAVDSEEVEIVEGSETQE